MKCLVLLTALTLGAPCLASETRDRVPPQSQQSTPEPSPKTPFAGLIAEYLRRDASGHSPSADEIAAMGTLQPQPDAASIAEAMPYLVNAMENPDIPLRTFALTAIIGLQSVEPATPESTTPSQPVVPAAASFKTDVAKALTPYISRIAAHLTSEESRQNRLLVATILGGFTPNPPSVIYPPLLAYLKRDDAIGPVGQAVVSDLLQIGPVNDEVAEAITRYLRRSDQDSDARSNLVDLIATKPNQSQTVNKALLQFLFSDDNSLRARVILSLPQLDLSSDVLADTKSRLDRIASDPSENLQVVTAAKSVAPCWNTVRMASGCPVY